MLLVSNRIYMIICHFLDDSSEEVLIFDDSTYDRNMKMGIRARYIRYLLMDSWFSIPSVISILRQHMHIICMLKDHPEWLYEYNGKNFD